MNLDEAQRKKVAAWIADGLKLSEIQNRIASEFGITLTYMDVRFLVDDLKLVPKDVDPPKPVTPVLPPAPPAVKPPASPAASPLTLHPMEAPAAGGNVSVQVDQIARPGSVVSGKVTFSDGQNADWYLDQNGRLGLAPQQTGYRPAPADVQKFQAAIETELSKIGF